MHGAAGGLAEASAYWTVKADAERLFRLKDLAKAEERYCRALSILATGASAELWSSARDLARDLARETSKCQSNRSLVLGKLGNAEAALEAANIAVAEDPVWPKAHARRAEALGMLGRHEQAAAGFYQAVERARSACAAGDQSAANARRWERDAQTQEQLANEKTVEAKRSQQEEAARRAAAYDERAAFEALCKQLIEYRVISTVQLADITRSVEGGKQSTTDMIAFWAPKASQAVLTEHTGRFKVLGTTAEIVLGALTPRSLSAIECTCRAFRAFGGKAAAERTRRNVWTRRLNAVAEASNHETLASEVTRFCMDVDTPIVAAILPLVRAACVALPVRQHGILISLGLLLGDSRRAPESAKALAGRAFWSDYTTWLQHQDQEREQLPLVANPVFFQVVLRDANSFGNSAVEAILQAISEHLSTSSDSYSELLQEDGEFLGSLADWQRVAKHHKKALLGVAWLYSHGLVTDIMRLLVSSDRELNVGEYGGPTDTTETVEMCCVLLSNLLGPLGQTIQQSALPGLLETPLVDTNQVFSTFCPDELPGGTDVVLHLLCLDRALEAEKIEQHFLANPTLLHRWSTALEEFCPLIEMVLNWGHVALLRIGSLIHSQCHPLANSKKQTADWMTFAHFLYGVAFEHGAHHLTTITSTSAQMALFFAGWYEQITLFNIALPRTHSWATGMQRERRDFYQ